MKNLTWKIWTGSFFLFILIVFCPKPEGRKNLTKSATKVALFPFNYKKGVVRSAQYSTSSKRHQFCGLFLTHIQHRTEGHGGCSWCVCVYANGFFGFLVLSLLSIQVRANCRLQLHATYKRPYSYVELTHVSKSVSFFCFTKKKNVHAAWNWVQSHAGPLTPVGGVCGQSEGWSLVRCPDRSVWLVTHIHRDAQGNWAIHLFFLCLDQWQDHCFIFF